MSTWIGSDGHEVEVIRLNGHTVLRLRRHGYLVAYCRSIAELTAYLDLDTLVEVADFPRPTAWPAGTVD
jgi:hypothetical protein